MQRPAHFLPAHFLPARVPASVLTFALALVSGSLLGCPAPQAGAAKTPTPAASLKPAPELKPAEGAPSSGPTTAVYEVTCGCAIKEIGHCGEYALIEGQQVEITDHGLGDMPFCGKPPAQATITGELKDGKLVASKVELVAK